VAHELDARFLEEGDNRVTAAAWYGAVMKPFHVDVKLSGKRNRTSLSHFSIRRRLGARQPGANAFISRLTLAVALINIWFIGAKQNHTKLRSFPASQTESQQSSEA